MIEGKIAAHYKRTKRSKRKKMPRHNNISTPSMRKPQSKRPCLRTIKPLVLCIQTNKVKCKIKASSKSYTISNEVNQKTFSMIEQMKRESIRRRILSSLANRLL